jgi:hypothetical protein
MGQINPAYQTLTTAGAGTLTAALLLGQEIIRSGPGGPVADTFDTAANILAALTASLSGFGGASWFVDYVNLTAYSLTLTAPAGGNFTLQGASAVIPEHSVARLLINVTAGGVVTVSVLYRVDYA